MRLFLSILVTALIIPLTAHAQAAPKQVEVVNDPLLVEVVSPAPPGPPAHWQLVGFTSATYGGDMGSHLGVTQKCQDEFPNSRMCTVLEVQQTTTIPEGLVFEAWANAGFLTNSGLTSGSDGQSCGHWISDSLTGTRILRSGRPIRSPCSSPVPIACCALVP